MFVRPYELRLNYCQQCLLKKDAYPKLFGAMRQAVTTTLSQPSNAELDKSSSEKMRKWAPTLGHQFLMCTNHTTMHVRQFSVIRRKLGKPILLDVVFIAVFCYELSLIPVIQRRRP